MVKHHLMKYIKLMTFLVDTEKALLNYKPPDFNLTTLFDIGLTFYIL
jgi:hypothetical protein